MANWITRSAPVTIDPHKSRFMAVNIPIPTEQFSITHKFAQDKVL